MNVIFPLLLGVIQGLSEFLPISSSGHLALFQNFFGDGLSKFDSITAFNVLLHLGTLVAVFIVYRKDIVQMIPAFFTMVKKLFSFKKKYKLSDYTYDERMDMMVIIGTLPLVALKLADIFFDKVCSFSILGAMEKYITLQPVVIGVILIFNGLLLFFSDKLTRKEKANEDFTPLNALFVGICQMFAVLPGLSRSGSTITGGRLSALSRRDAVRFSFLLSIPAILGSFVTEIPDMFSEGNLGAGDWMIFLLAAAVACIIGLLSMKLLNYIAEKDTFKGFSYYCWAVGGIAIIAGIIKLTLA